MAKIIPFSNATEASWWLYDNCEKCRRIGCTKKRAIDFAWVSGCVSQKVADYVGDFSSQCKNFTLLRINEKVKEKVELTKKLF